MDYSFSEQQEIFRTQVRDFLKKECPMSLVRQTEDKKLDYSPELYRKMADLGWFQLMIPTEYEGIGGSWVDLAILYEEVGRALLPGPHYTTTLCGQVILALANEAYKQELLPKITTGESILSLALTEPEAGSELSLLTTSATSSDDSYVITGTKLFIAYAHIADYIIVVGREKDKRLALFLVPKGAEGVTCAPLDTLSGERLCEVVFDNVKLPKKQLLGKCGHEGDLLSILDKMKIMICAEMVGAAAVALEMAVDYSKQRISLDRPIGSFQVLQHKMVDMAIAIEGARWLVYQTSWMNDEGIPCAKESAAAQLYIGRVCNWILLEAMLIYGAVSLVKDHDLTLFFRRVKANQLKLGPADSLRETIAQAAGI